MQNFNIELKNWLDSLGRLDRLRATTLICQNCKVKKRKLYNWTNAGCKVEPIYQDQIQKIRQEFQ